MDDKIFRQTIWDYYSSSKREMPWRNDTSPYSVVVSELMLQQTQVARVLPKYVEFMQVFPTIQTLADAHLSDVLRLWSGLGYNRRAKYLHETAKQVEHSFSGDFPSTLEELITLPGIGKNTAGAILAYAFNEPIVFIETNVRTVFLYHFFSGEEKVSDAELLPLIERTLDKENPREWYWAIMDYGSMLKKEIGNINRKASANYVKQSAFEGSKRQVRGAVLKHLTNKRYTKSQLQKKIDDERFDEVIVAMAQEGLISIQGKTIELSN